jgi:predicted esterase
VLVTSPLIERTLSATTHGRYLVLPPADSSRPAPLLVGFHGYAEDARVGLDRLRAISGAESWRLVSIQGLHRFYQRRTNEVVASWMTRQDRDLAIEDNLGYVTRVIDAVSREWASEPSVVFAGFSQGVAMAFRAGTHLSHLVAGIIAVGGDIPPEIDRSSLARVPAVLVCRGGHDKWYSAEAFATDQRRLEEAGVKTRVLEFAGGHEWSAEVLDASQRFLQGRRLPNQMIGP